MFRVRALQTIKYDDGYHFPGDKSEVFMISEKHAEPLLAEGKVELILSEESEVKEARPEKKSKKK